MSGINPWIALLLSIIILGGFYYLSITNQKGEY